MGDSKVSYVCVSSVYIPSVNQLFFQGSRTTEDQEPPEAHPDVPGPQGHEDGEYRSYCQPDC